MALNVPVFYQRTVSAIVFAVIMLVGLLWNDIAFILLIYIINVLCLREYVKLMKKIDESAYWPLWMQWVLQSVSFAVFIIIRASDRTISYTQFSTTVHVAEFVAPLLVITPAILLIITVTSKKTSFTAFLQLLGGLLYITLPMVLLYQMRLSDWLLPAALIFMIWSNDTLAYLVGSFIGKTPFSPISPKKTWEGTAGGAILTMIAAGVYGYFSHKFRIVDWIMLGLCATVAGTLGDLVESKLKRMAGVKDSGTMMPGHGGALDRFDSLLLAAPFAAAYVLFFMQW